MEQLTDKGLHLDDLQRLRVLEPDATEQVVLFVSNNTLNILFHLNLNFQAKDLKDECGNLTQQMDEFRKMTDTFISLTDQVFINVFDAVHSV